MGLTLKKKNGIHRPTIGVGGGGGAGGGGGGQDVHPLNALIIKWDREQQDLT